MYVHDNSVSNCARVRTHATAPIVVYEYRISHDPTLQEDTAQICIWREVVRNLVALQPAKVERVDLFGRGILFE